MFFKGQLNNKFRSEHKGELPNQAVKNFREVRKASDLGKLRNLL
jgi:hypothetical protein